MDADVGAALIAKHGGEYCPRPVIRDVPKPEMQLGEGETDMGKGDRRGGSKKEKLTQNRKEKAAKVAVSTKVAERAKAAAK